MLLLYRRVLLVQQFKVILKNSYCTENNDDKKVYKIPTEPSTCCMSGCNNCVWIEYAETLSKIFNDSGEKAQKIILEKVTDPSMRAYLAMELRRLQDKKKS